MSKPISFTAALVQHLSNDADMPATIREWMTTEPDAEERVMKFAEALRLDFEAVKFCNDDDGTTAMINECLRLASTHTCWSVVARRLLKRFTSMPRIAVPVESKLRFESPPAWWPCTSN